MLEIEHKFLLKCFPGFVDVTTGWYINQGYMFFKKIRVRESKPVFSIGQKFKYHIAVKFNLGGIKRLEFEREIPEYLYKFLWKFTNGSRVKKIRYEYYDYNNKWEIDEFIDRTLCLAELEVPSVDHKFDIPKELEKFIIKDVSTDKEYYNVCLAK